MLNSSVRHVELLRPKLSADEPARKEYSSAKKNISKNEFQRHQELGLGDFGDVDLADAQFDESADEPLYIQLFV